MSGLILPPTLAVLLTALSPCFQARSVLVFQWLVVGWIQCQGRRTLTGVALASGAVGERHISAFHRFFSRASWSLDALGRVVFTLALAWLPTDQPLVVLGDDTLARKGGKSIALASMHHDPLLSSGRKSFASFGHVWVVLALWLPLPFGTGRGFALPVLFRLYVGAKRGGEQQRAGRRQGRAGPRLRAARKAHAKHRPITKLELLREMVAVLAQWADERTVYLVVDSAYAGRTLLEDRPANVQVISRLRWDAALYAPPPPRQPGQKGGPVAVATACRRSSSGAVGIGAGPRCRWSSTVGRLRHAPSPSSRCGTAPCAPSRSGSWWCATPVDAAAMRRSSAPIWTVMPLVSSPPTRAGGHWRSPSSTASSTSASARLRTRHHELFAAPLRSPVWSTAWSCCGPPRTFSRAAPSAGSCAPGIAPRPPSPSPIC